MLLMLQVAPRVWPAGAVHDTVQAVVRGAAFRRSLQRSIAERLLGWLGEWIARLVRLLHVTTSARYLALALAALVVLLVVARLVLGARARGAGRDEGQRGPGVLAGEDPWRAADRLAGLGRYEEAAHALYRGVLASATRSDRLLLHPSKTSGDYARELRARGSPRHAAFRAFGRRFDVAVFGRGDCDAALIDDLRRLAAPFLPQARAA
jgi:hypothetical protein